ncbi:MAG: TetR/AcrR family transcriptional regulator [Puia sp.]|nr:TetR/AcrR family transcriptional regulator [Puia sp.]
MDAAGTTREKIVNLGRDFVQTVGYHAFKYQQIAATLKIKNASIHYYFPNKEDLGVAIIEKDEADFKDLTRRMQYNTPTEKAEAILLVYARYLESKKNLCVIGSCSSAFLDIPERMQIAAKRYLEELSTWLTRVFADGLASGEFRFTSKPEDLAALWMATLPGALQTAQVRGTEYFDQVCRQLRKSYRE